VHQALEAGERIASPRAFIATVTTRLPIVLGKSSGGFDAVIA